MSSTSSSPSWAERSHEHVFRMMNDVLATAALPTVPISDATLDVPIVYVVGAPRSGTTLLAQVLCRYLEVGYVNNLIARFWRRPSIGVYLSQALAPSTDREQITLESLRGETYGAAGPHEFGHFWSHWFHLDRAATHRLTPQESVRVDWEGLRETLHTELLAPFGLPVMFRNIVCGFQAEMLSAIHPSSLFVYIERDSVDTCVSVFRSRESKFGSIDQWWSLRPTALAQLPSDPLDQIVAQVVETKSELTKILRSLGHNSLMLEYKTLCEKPQGVVDLVLDRLQGNFGSTVEIRGHPSPLPVRSTSAADQPIAREFRRRLMAYIPVT
jgi:hypothetical protein